MLFSICLTVSHWSALINSERCSVSLIAGHFRIEATPQKTDGGTVMTDTKTWGDGIPGGGPNVATEVYVVEDGKITSITWTPTEETMAAMEAVGTVQALADALNAGDLDAAMTLIADDAVFDMSDGEPLVGADQIRELFDYLIAGHFRIEATPQKTDGGTVMTDTKTWGDGIPGGGPNIATEVYVVEDGKITSITWTPSEETMAAMEAVGMVQALADALNAGDLDAAMTLIADDAVFDMADGEPLVGADQIRELFDYLIAGHFRIEATPQKTDGGTVMTDTKTWGDGIPGGGPNVATEVYVIENGKITSITWTPTEETRANMEACRGSCRHA